jgi:hypothetical protein
MQKLFVPLALVAIMFASCEKYETSDELSLSTLPTVTLTGTVYADLDETVAGLEYAPEGTIVRVSVPYSDYNSGSNGNWVSEPVKLGADGKFSVNVHVTSDSINATVSFEDFEHAVVKLDNVGREYSELTYFKCSDKKLSGLGIGEANHIVDNIVYSGTVINSGKNDNFILKPTTEVTVSGKLEYQSDSAYRSVPETTVMATITLTDPTGKQYTTEKPVPVGYGGIYSLTVPMVINGTATVKLQGENFWTFTDVFTNKRAIYRYTLNASMTVYNFSPQTNKDHRFTKDAKVNDID